MTKKIVDPEDPTVRLARAEEVYDTRFPFRPSPLNPVASPFTKLMNEMGPGTDSTELFAHDYKEAEKDVKKRHLHETVVAMSTSTPPTVLPSEWWDAGNIPQALHAACWLGFVALMAKTSTPDELLNDGGIIHNLSHLMLPPSNFRGNEALVERLRGKMGDMLRALEAKTPGFTRPVPVDLKALYPDIATA